MNKEDNTILYWDDKCRITLVTGRIRRTINLYSVIYVEVEKRNSSYIVTFKLGEDDYLHIKLDKKEEVDKLVNITKNIDSSKPRSYAYENSHKLF